MYTVQFIVRILVPPPQDPEPEPANRIKIIIRSRLRNTGNNTGTAEDRFAAFGSTCNEYILLVNTRKGKQGARALIRSAVCHGMPSVVDASNCLDSTRDLPGAASRYGTSNYFNKMMQFLFILH
jgi:hypothetical protein